jgi:hypothetical protein
MIRASQKQGTLMRLRGIALVLTGLAACATGSEFMGEKLAREAPSFQEGLWECGRYSMPSPSRRPGDFLPLVECVEGVGRAHRPDPSTRFFLFEKEIRDRYRSVNALSWSPAVAEEIEVATRAALRLFWEKPGGERRIAAREKALLTRHFPQLAWELRIAAWPVNEAFRIEPELERLRAGVAALEEKGTAQPERCRELRDLRQETTFLAALYRDLGDLAEITAPGGSALGIRQWERYRTRVNLAQQQLNALRARIVESSARAEAPVAVDPVGTRLQGACPPRSPDA